MLLQCMTLSGKRTGGCVYPQHEPCCRLHIKVAEAALAATLTVKQVLHPKGQTAGPSGALLLLAT